MKKSRKNLITLVGTMAALLIAGACSQDREPDLHEKTPISLGNLSVQVTDIDTRAAAKDFFEPGDALSITTAPVTAARTATWVNDASGFGAISPVLYLEDVYANGAPTHTFAGSFGSPALLTDQSTAALLHGADYVSGAFSLDVADKSKPKLTSAAMTHQHTQLVINITKGVGWASNDAFLKYQTDNSASYSIHTSGAAGATVSPYKANGADAFTLTAILPTANLVSAKDGILLTIHLSRGRAHTLKLTAAITPAAGKAITVTAAYNNSDTVPFDVPSVTVNPWEMGNTDTELPGTAP